MAPRDWYARGIRLLGRTAVEVCRRLRDGSPPCYVGHWALDEGKLLLNPLHLNDERAAELARRLREELEVLEKVSQKANLTVVLGEKGLADRVVKLL